MPLAANSLVKIMLATPLPHKDNALTYIAKGALKVGQLVQVPLRHKQTLGMVLAAGDASVPRSRLKQATPLPIHMPEDIQRFIPWVAGWYMETQGAVLKMALPNVAAVTMLLKQGLAVAKSEKPQPATGQHKLTKDQAAAAHQLLAAVKQRKNNKGDNYDAPLPFLLDGVTGSGKTEVYFEAVAETLAQAKQVLILLPEIALSASFQQRFADRFGFAPLLWHSNVTPAKRRAVWGEVLPKTPLVVAGARSALFLPFYRLGLIVVDEEHDQSYRQDEGTRYHARDMAVVRARLARIPLVLASATPSLESEVNADGGRYKRLSLSRRIGAAGMPSLKLVDLATTPPEKGRWLAPPLVDAMGETLAKGDQVLLFLNRRGYAPMSLCRACGYRLQCPNCSAWLVSHSRATQQILQCHHCGHRLPYPEVCPKCDAGDSLIACGPGVERLEEEVAARFPDYQRGIFSSDVIASQWAGTDVIAKVVAGEIDVIIGTQMIAKGHHFPNLTLVGVVDADLGLSGGDLRASETSWQLLMQVAGRAGRADKPGRVFIQTAVAKSPIIKSLIAGDRPAFIASEKAARRKADMPPFGRLAGVILSATDDKQLVKAAEAMRVAWPNYQAITLLGPAPAPLWRVRRRYRMRFLLKCKKEVNLQQAIRVWLDAAPLPSNIRCKVDIDPINFL